jgi:hypothetical protein
MAVIPYGDLYKLFEMLNKHTKPYDQKKMRKKIRKMTTPRPTLPPPTTKRTAELQPKVIKRTRLKGKKKKKKTVHVSFYLLKFICSEKATRFENIYHIVLKFTL